MRLDPLLPANPFGSSEHWTHMSDEPLAQEVRRNGVRLVQRNILMLQTYSRLP